MKRIALLGAAFAVAAAVVGLLKPWRIWGEPDAQLLAALHDGHLKRFESLLKKGADPNAIFGAEPSDWVMCEATRQGKEDFLKLAVQYGGNINLRNGTPPLRTSIVHASTSAPILCAIFLHNDRSFDYLVSSGVDLGIPVRVESKPMPKSEFIKPELWGKTHYGSPLTTATTFNEYRMAYQIMNKKKLSEEELWTLKQHLEKYPIDLSSDSNVWRMKVVELLREQGHEVQPWMGNAKARQK